VGGRAALAMQFSNCLEACARPAVWEGERPAHELLLGARPAKAWARLRQRKAPGGGGPGVERHRPIVVPKTAHDSRTGRAMLRIVSKSANLKSVICRTIAFNVVLINLMYQRIRSLRRRN